MLSRNLIVVALLGAFLVLDVSSAVADQLDPTFYSAVVNAKPDSNSVVALSGTFTPTSSGNPFEVSAVLNVAAVPTSPVNTNNVLKLLTNLNVPSVASGDSSTPSTAGSFTFGTQTTNLITAVNVGAVYGYDQTTSSSTGIEISSSGIWLTKGSELMLQGYFGSNNSKFFLMFNDDSSGNVTMSVGNDGLYKLNYTLASNDSQPFQVFSTDRSFFIGTAPEPGRFVALLGIVGVCALGLVGQMLRKGKMAVAVGRT